MPASRESVAVIGLAVGIAMTILTVVIHALALRSILAFVRYQRLHGRAGVSFWEDVTIVAGAVLVAFSAHLAEIAALGFPILSHRRISRLRRGLLSLGDQLHDPR